MYRYIPETNEYVYTSNSEVQTYQSSYTETTEQYTTEEQWTVSMEHGYAKAQASDVLFQNDPKVVHTPKVAEDYATPECVTWYQAKTPIEKPSNSTEYVAPHRRFVGYDQTNTYYRTSNIRRRNTISSSGDSSHHNAHSRSTSRQPQFQPVPQHTRSVSRATRYPARAPAVARERAQQKPQLMPVYNMVGSKRKTRRSSTTKSQQTFRRSPHQRSRQQVQPEETQLVRKVKGRWIKGDVARPTTSKAVCFQFRDQGFCDWGLKCRFSHDIPQKKTYTCTYTRTQRRSTTIKTAPSTPVCRNRFDVFNAPREQTF